MASTETPKKPGGMLRRAKMPSCLKNGNPIGDISNAKRCGAKKRRKEDYCRGPAMSNGRCRIHGGLSTGPKTQEGIERIRKANWKTGKYSKTTKLDLERNRAFWTAEIQKLTTAGDSA